MLSKILPILTLTLALHQAAAFFQLHADPQELTPEIGEGLRLECNYSTSTYVATYADGSTSEPGAIKVGSSLAAIDEIRLVKQLPTGAWGDVFTVHAYDNKYEWGNTGNVKGDRGRWNVDYNSPSATFLVVEWEETHEDQLGKYRCDVIGVDSLNELAMESSNDITISGAALTPEGVLSIAQTMIEKVKVETSALRDDNDDIDTEVASLGNKYDSLKNEVTSLKEKNTDLQGDIDTLKAEVEALKADKNKPIKCSEVTSCLSSKGSTG